MDLKSQIVYIIMLKIKNYKNKLIKILSNTVNIQRYNNNNISKRVYKGEPVELRLCVHIHTQSKY